MLNLRAGLRLGIIVLTAGFVHLAVGVLLPPPFSYLQIIFLVIVWLIIINARYFLAATLIWIFWLETYSALPFGVNGVGLLAGVALVYWLLHHVFPRHSLLLVSFLGAGGLLVYRSVVFLLLLIINVADSRFNFTFSYGLLRVVGWEIALTTVVLAASYLFGQLILKKLKFEYLKYNSDYHGKAHF